MVNEVTSLSEQISTLTTSLQSSETDSSSHIAELEKLHTDLESGRGKIAAAASDTASLADVRGELGKAHSRIQELESAQAQSGVSNKASAKEVKAVGGKLKVNEEEIERLKKENAELKASALSNGGGGGGKKGAGTGAANKKAAEMEKQMTELKKELEGERGKREEGEKEHEDLLVLLEELSQKRKRDKEKMKTGGMDVSEGEEDDDGDGDEVDGDD